MLENIIRKKLKDIVLTDEQIFISIYKELSESNIDVLLCKPNDTNKLIGISGLVNSGKTTFQNILKNYLNKKNINVVCLNFADPLKEICSRVFHMLPKESFYGSQSEKEILYDINGIMLSGRKIMQIIGTDIAREFNNNFWVNYQLKLLSKYNDSYIIYGDVRFNNEAFLIHDHSGIVCKIYRKSQYDSEHISEAGIENNVCNYIIENDQTIEELENKILPLMTFFNIN